MGWSPAPGRGEDGFSIIETVVALALLAIILPSFLGLIFTEAASARIQRTSATNNQAQLALAEAVKALPYSPGPGSPASASCYPTATLPAGSLGSALITCSMPVTPLAAGYSVEQVTIQVFAGPSDTGQSKTLVVVRSARSS